MNPNPPPPSPDEEGVRLAVEGVLRARFGRLPSRAADRALARLRAEHAARPGWFARLAGALRRSLAAIRPQSWIGWAGWATAAAAVVFGLTLVEWTPRPRLFDPRGDVTVHGGGGARRAREGGALRRGEFVRTGVGATVTVGFRREATRLELAGESQLEWLGEVPGKRFRLTSGALQATVAHQPADRPLVLETPGARAAVLGTKFALRAQPQESAIEVESGRVLVSGLDEKADGRVVEALEVGRIVTGGNEVEVAAMDPKRTVGVGLLAHWPLDDGRGATARDASGAGRALSFERFDSWLPGGGIAMRSRLARAHSEEVDLGDRFALAFWCRVAAPELINAKTNFIRPLLSNSEPGLDKDGFRIFVNRIERETRDVVFEISDGTFSAATRSANGRMRYEVWQHVVINADRAAGRARIFVDGQDATMGSGALPRRFQTASPLWIGSMGRRWGSAVDLRDVRVYGRLLEEAEIQHLAGLSLTP